MAGREPYPYYSDFDKFFQPDNKIYLNPTYYGDINGTFNQLSNNPIVKNLESVKDLPETNSNKISINKDKFKDHLVKFLKEGLEVSIDTTSEQFNHKVNKFLKVIKNG